MTRFGLFPRSGVDVVRVLFGTTAERSSKIIRNEKSLRGNFRNG